MARKPLKLTKNALMLLGIIALLLITFLVLKFGGTKSEQPEKKVTKTLSGLVVENQVLKVQLLDFVSNKDFDDKYQEVSMDIKADEEVLNYKISNRQVFNKVMQLLPPGEGSPLLNNSSEVPTHEAYILVLTGDIVEYKDSEGKSSYQIANARLDYYKQSLLLENDYDSVYIASIDGKKEKMVKITAYKEALSSPSEYMTMLQW
ncbi:hypothetical protein PM724_00455 [Erysipelatoclostridium ramosum]|uniref:hypothetical protein n=1 Tax=Thomasclavelia ramosa TaxID=1547 RepID=UPI0018AB143A|nr:hypothetical protein [Thomasclavelia ramosa]MDB7092393.1 hypothetical protein [Thomasclavelia ramosa]